MSPSPLAGAALKADAQELLCLDSELARAEPKRLRYTLFHAAGIIVRSGRRTRLRIAAGWPWTDQLVNAFTRVHALALRT